MKNIAILGSTGSIGQNALKVIKEFPGDFRAIALTANSNVELLKKQIEVFNPELVCVADEKAALKLKHSISPAIKFFTGERGLLELLKDRRIDKVVLSITGSKALEPLLMAIDNKKEIALANKESLVMGGSLVMRRAEREKVNIIPIDSEQSAIWQCLKNEKKDKIRKVYLTASGGPFFRLNKDKLKNIKASSALRHPRWKMGKKITIDSATLMNKGLEFLEAMYLFNLKPEDISVLVHPEAIIHSMVEFIDGVIMAQLSVTDMRIPIQYALSYPERLPNRLRGVDFVNLKSLNFSAPDLNKFPCLGLAYQAAKDSGTMPCVMNAANEVSVDAFLKGALSFFGISSLIEKVLSGHKNIENPALNDIYAADEWARRRAKDMIGRVK